LFLHAARLFFLALLCLALSLRLGLGPLLVHESLICRALGRKDPSPVRLWRRWRRC
jgi:hypothetical protein